MRIAMIPARGGSKRIPRKNIKNFLGKPIIAYSIEAALQANCFDHVIVSTDSQEIADVAKEYGAEVPFLRPSEISGDYATTIDVIKHCLNWYANNHIEISKICCIYATAPFISASTILQSLDSLIKGDFSYAFTATTFPYPIQRAIVVSESKSVEMLHPKEFLTRSQDLPETYHDAGQLYWGEAQAFLDDIPLFSKAATVILLPRYKVQDIDTLEDWYRAEAMYKVLESLNAL